MILYGQSLSEEFAQSQFVPYAFELPVGFDETLPALQIPLKGDVYKRQGQHFAVEELFNDKADQCLLMREAMKYYANILQPYSPLVAKKIPEIQGLNLPIEIIAPSHGAIWRENPQ